METNGIIVSLKEQLQGFSAVNVGAESTATALEERLRRFGPVSRSEFPTFRQALDYLLPIKSFTTRFLILGVDSWSIILTDMKGENCYVDAYSVSRTTQCNAIGLSLLQERRELHVFERGKKVRQVQSLRDGDRWYFREEGVLQPFEDPAEYRRKRKGDRLSVSALVGYFESYTGFKIPHWENSGFKNIYGLERSTKDTRAPVLHFMTINDV